MQPKSEWAKSVHDVFLMGGLDKGTIILLQLADAVNFSVRTRLLRTVKDLLESTASIDSFNSVNS